MGENQFVVLDGRQTCDALPFGNLVNTLRLAFAKGATVPERHHHQMPQSDGTMAVLLLMPAWQEGGYLGVKIVNVFPGNVNRGLSGLHSAYLLFDGTTGKQLALLDGDGITSRRTASVAALAASFLAKADASSLLVVGSGRVASLLAQAFSEVRPITSIAVWDRVPEKAEVLSQRLRESGYAAHSVAVLEDAVRQADIITCATLATEPIIKGKWLKPGTHLDLIGGFMPDMREADDDCIRHARIWMDTRDAAKEAGDLVQPLQQGLIAEGAIAGTLAQLCAGEIGGRASDREITVFKSVGTALADLAAGVLAFRSHLAAAERDS